MSEKIETEAADKRSQNLAFLGRSASEQNVSEDAPVNKPVNSHPDRADTLVKPNPVQRPNRLETSGGITLRTRLAHKLLYGRLADKTQGVHSITGLVQFTKNVGSIWDAAEADDPYADMALLEIEQSYDDAVRVIETRLKAIRDRLTHQLQSVNSNIMYSVEPVRLDVQFYSLWAYRGAMLLAKYDQLVLAYMTAKQAGLTLEDDWASTVVRCGTRVRAVFEQSKSWMQTNVTRDDIAANNQVAQHAEKQYANKVKTMLVMPEDVLQGERRATLAPKIKPVKST